MCGLMARYVTPVENEIDRLDREKDKAVSAQDFEEAAQLLEADPSAWSPGVLLRPLTQDALLPASPENPDGYWEHRELRALHDALPLLRASGKVTAVTIQRRHEQLADDAVESSRTPASEGGHKTGGLRR